MGRASTCLIARGTEVMNEGHVRDIRRASECKSLMTPLMAPYAAKHRSKRGGPNHHYDHTGFPRARRARSYHLAFRAVAHGIRLRRCRREGEEPAQRAEPCAPIGWAYPRTPAWECFRIPPSSAKPAAVGARRSLLTCGMIAATNHANDVQYRRKLTLSIIPSRIRMTPPSSCVSPRRGLPVFPPKRQRRGTPGVPGTPGEGRRSYRAADFPA